MRATHWAINFSNACDQGGSGVCDGEVPAGESNPNAVTSECTCKCHTAEDLPETIEGVKAWHDAWHGPEVMTVGEEARLIVRQGLAHLIKV